MKFNCTIFGLPLLEVAIVLVGSYVFIPPSLAAIVLPRINTAAFFPFSHNILLLFVPKSVLFPEEFVFVW
jgi:hypothetical protein